MLAVATRECVHPADQIRERSQVVGALERRARQQRGKRQRHCIHVTPGVESAAVDAIDDRLEVGALAEDAVDPRGHEVAGIDQVVAKLGVLVHVGRYSPLWTSNICALWPAIRSLLIMSGAPCASRNSRPML